MPDLLDVSWDEPLFQQFGRGYTVFLMFTDIYVLGAPCCAAVVVYYIYHIFRQEVRLLHEEVDAERFNRLLTFLDEKEQQQQQAIEPKIIPKQVLDDLGELVSGSIKNPAIVRKGKRRLSVDAGILEEAKRRPELNPLDRVSSFRPLQSPLSSLGRDWSPVQPFINQHLEYLVRMPLLGPYFLLMPPFVAIGYFCQLGELIATQGEYPPAFRFVTSFIIMLLYSLLFVLLSQYLRSKLVLYRKFHGLANLQHDEPSSSDFSSSRVLEQSLVVSEQKDQRDKTANIELSVANSKTKAQDEQHGSDSIELASISIDSRHSGYGFKKLWLQYRSLLWVGIAGAFVAAATTSVRATLQFPSCAPVEKLTLQQDSDHCSSAVNLGRGIESAVASFYVTIVPSICFFATVGWENMRRFAPFVLVTAVIAFILTLVIDRLDEQQIWWHTALQFMLALIVTLVFGLHRNRPYRWSFFKGFVGSFVLLGAFLLFNTEVVIPLYQRAVHEAAKLVVVLFVYPVTTNVARITIDALLAEIRRDYFHQEYWAIVLLGETLFSFLGRLFLINMKSIEVQMVAVLIFFISRTTRRITSPVQAFIFRYVLSGFDKKRALRHSEKVRTSRYFALKVNLRMVTEISAILWAAAGTLILKAVYDIESLSTEVLVVAGFIQLIGQMSSDVVSIRIEEAYMERSALTLWARPRVKYAVALLLVFYSIFAAGYMAQDFILIVEPKP